MGRSKNKSIYYGNRFYAIPIATECENIVIKDIYVIQVPDILRKAFKLVLDRQIDGIGKFNNKNRFSPKRFSRNLKALNYPIISSQDSFYTNDGEWLYLIDEIDMDVLHGQLSRWCREYLEKKQYDYISKYITDICLVKKDIVIPSKPYNLNEKEKYYLYNFYPQYLAYILSGKLKVSIESRSKEGFTTQHDFYKLQNGGQKPEMIALPFKQTKKGYAWTYSLDLLVRTIEGMDYPFLFLNMRANRFLDSLPRTRGRGLNAVVSKKENGTYKAFKLPLSFRKNENQKREWCWSYDLTTGFKSNSLNDLNMIPSKVFNRKDSEIMGLGKGVGIIFGNHIRCSHPVNPRSSEYDEYAVYDEVLNILRKIDCRTNINYLDFLNLENILDRLGSNPDKDTLLRFEQLSDLLTVDAYYSTEAWLSYLKDAIIELFNPRVFNAGQSYAKADDINFNEKDFEFDISYKNKSVELLKRIRINRIKIDERLRGEFFFDPGLEQVKKFKQFLSEYISPVEEVRASLFELEYEEVTEKGETTKVFEEKLDPKSIIRNLLAENNRVSQFISFQSAPYIEFDKNDKKNSEVYKKILMKHLNGVKDLFRQLGIIGKSPVKEFEEDYPVFVGLWFMSKMKSSFDYGEEDRLSPYKLTLPILVALINDEVKIAVFSDSIFNTHRRIGKNFQVEWLPYKEGLVKISQVSGIFDELNEDYAKDLKRQFVNNALSSIYTHFPEKQIILFTNAQNSRQYISGLTNESISDADLNLDLEGESTNYWSKTVLIRLVTDERNETPGWSHIDCEGNPIFESLFQGAFKLTDRIYYLINAKSDNHSPSKDVKELDPFNTGLRMSALEVGVYKTSVEDVEKYVHLTDVLRSRSMPIHYATPIRFPLPLHLAYCAEEYLTAYYDEYFLMRYLKNND